MGREEIEGALRETIWSPLAVQAVLASKAAKRCKRGLALKIFSLDAAPLEGTTSIVNKVAIEDFVDKAYEAVRESGKPYRFQLAMRSSPVHWTAVDVVVTPEDGVKMLNIDSAGDPSSSMASSVMFDRFKRKYTSDANQNSRFFWLRHDDIPGTDKLRQIQYDGESCSRFTLDTLFHVSNIDTFPLLEKHKDSFKKSRIYPDEFGFSADTVPEELSAIYRGTQSKSAFESLPAKLKGHVINKKGETLEASEARHTEEVRVDSGNVRHKNMAIQHKKKHYIEDTNAFLAGDSALDEVASREVFAALETGAFITSPKVNAKEVVSFLVDEAQVSEATKGSFSSLKRYYHSWKNHYSITSAQAAEEAGDHRAAINCLEEMAETTDIYKSQLRELRQRLSEQDGDYEQRGIQIGKSN